jgi:hypothetical protein
MKTSERSNSVIGELWGVPCAPIKFVRFYAQIKNARRSCYRSSLFCLTPYAAGCLVASRVREKFTLEPFLVKRVPTNDNPLCLGPTSLRHRRDCASEATERCHLTAAQRRTTAVAALVEAIVLAEITSAVIAK